MTTKTCIACKKQLERGQSKCSCGVIAQPIKSGTRVYFPVVRHNKVEVSFGTINSVSYCEGTVPISSGDYMNQGWVYRINGLVDPVNETAFAETALDLEMMVQADLHASIKQVCSTKD